MTQAVMGGKHVCRCSPLGGQGREFADSGAEDFKLVVGIARVDGLALVAGESFTLRNVSPVPARFIMSARMARAYANTMAVVVAASSQPRVGSGVTLLMSLIESWRPTMDAVISGMKAGRPGDGVVDGVIAIGLALRARAVGEDRHGNELVDGVQ